MQVETPHSHNSCLRSCRARQRACTGGGDDGEEMMKLEMEMVKLARKKAQLFVPERSERRKCKGHHRTDPNIFFVIYQGAPSNRPEHFFVIYQAIETHGIQISHSDR